MKPNSTACALMSGLLLAASGSWAHTETQVAPSLKAGEKVPSLSIPSANDGRTRTVDYPKGRTTVLLLFLPECPHCHKMIPEWNREFARKPANLDVYGLMMAAEPPGFFNVFSFAFPVLRYPGKDAQAQFKLTKVPMMIRVGPGGLVQDVAHGVIDPIRLGEIFRP